MSMPILSCFVKDFKSVSPGGILKGRVREAVDALQKFISAMFRSDCGRIKPSLLVGCFDLVKETLDVIWTKSDFTEELYNECCQHDETCDSEEIYQGLTLTKKKLRVVYDRSIGLIHRTGRSRRSGRFTEFFEEATSIIDNLLANLAINEDYKKARTIRRHKDHQCSYSLFIKEVYLLTKTGMLPQRGPMNSRSSLELWSSLEHRISPLELLSAFSESECPVCLDHRLTEETNFAVLGSCRHLTCVPCATKLFGPKKTGSSRMCPLCRTPVAAWTTSFFFQDFKTRKGSTKTMDEANRTLEEYQLEHLFTEDKETFDGA